MPVLNKPAIIAQIAEKTGNTKAETERFLNAFQEIVIDSVTQGIEVKLTGFVAFSKAVREARVMKNPRTTEEIEVPETSVPRLRALKHFRDRVAGRD